MNFLVATVTDDNFAEVPPSEFVSSELSHRPLVNSEADDPILTDDQ